VSAQCRTQKELDIAIKKGVAYIDLVGGGDFTVTACDSSTVRACGSSTVRAYGSSTVRAYDSSTVRAYDSSTVTAYDSSTVRACGSSTVTACGSSTVTACDSSTVTAYDSSTVTAYDSSTVTAYDSSTVTAYGSSTVRAYDSSTVRAYGSSTVRAYDSSTVTATKFVPVQDHGPNTKITGGILISIRRAETPADWCEFYGVHVARGIATLFKAVEDDWKGTNKHPGITYEPGSKPEAPDWNPTATCGKGLHLSPRPFMALWYCPNATRYVACPVRMSEMVLLDDKVKVRRLAKPTFEVDIDGEPVAS